MIDLGIFDYEVIGVFVIPLPPQQGQKGEPHKSTPLAERRLGEQAAGGCDSGYGYDDKSVFPPDLHPVGMGVLEKVDRLPSFPARVSYNEEGEMQNVENDVVANASYNRTLRWEFVWVSVAG